MAASESFERALKESIRNVLQRFDSVDKLSDEQTSGVFNFIQCKDVLAVLPTGSGKLLFPISNTCSTTATREGRIWIQNFLYGSCFDSRKHLCN